MLLNDPTVFQTSLTDAFKSHRGEAGLEHWGRNEGELLIRQNHIKWTDDWSSKVR